jgi:hypothetical protein
MSDQPSEFAIEKVRYPQRLTSSDIVPAQNMQFALCRDFPDYVRRRAEEKF